MWSSSNTCLSVTSLLKLLFMQFSMHLMPYLTDFLCPIVIHVELSCCPFSLLCQTFQLQCWWWCLISLPRMVLSLVAKGGGLGIGLTTPPCKKKNASVMETTVTLIPMDPTADPGQTNGSMDSPDQNFLTGVRGRTDSSRTQIHQTHWNTEHLNHV